MAAQRLSRHNYRVTTPSGNRVTYRMLTLAELKRLVARGYTVEPA